MNQKLNCIFICNELLPNPWGGIGNYTLNISNAIAKSGINVMVVGLYNKKNEQLDCNVNALFKYASLVPLKVFPKNYKSGSLLRYGIEGFIHRRQIYEYLKKITQKPGKWIIEWPDYEGLWFYPNPNPNVIEVHKIHGSTFLQPYPGLPTMTTMWEARQYQRLTHWSSVSQYYLNFVLSKINSNKKDVFVSYIPINTDLFRKIKNNDQKDYKLITFCGNANPKKHPISVAKAFSQIAEKHSKLKLIFAGNVFLKEHEIRKYIDTDLQKRVEFKGLLTPSQVASLLNLTTIFCMPSEHESFGIAWVEAMACGVPVIAGKGSCGEEIITHESGFFVDPNNSDEIAAKMEILLDNPELCHRMGSTGNKIVSDCYASDIVANKTIDWYLSLFDANQ